MKKLGVILIAMALLSGCAAKGRWVNNNVTQEQANRDQYECQHNAELVCQYWSPQVGILSGAICVINHYKSCVQSRGYVWEKID